MEWSDKIVRVTGQALRDLASKPLRVELKDRKQAELETMLRHSLDDLGLKSAKAQGLGTYITSYSKLQLSPTSACYLIFEGSTAIGLLKVGVKQLFVAPPAASSLVCINPLCVLDFFVSTQRQGIGKILFDCMLIRERKTPAELAYDKPSFKLLGFLQKHYGLSRYIPQTINFVVFNDFYRPHPQLENLEISGLLEIPETQRCKENIVDFRKRRIPN